MDQIIQQCDRKWFALIGDNGFGYVSSEVDIIDGLRKLLHVTVIQMANQDDARNYAYCAYASRWFMRNSWQGKGIELPINLPPDYIYLDPQFESREGGRNLPYFPALLH